MAARGPGESVTSSRRSIRRFRLARARSVGRPRDAQRRGGVVTAQALPDDEGGLRHDSVGGTARRRADDDTGGEYVARIAGSLFGEMNAAGWTIATIAIGIAPVIAWRELERRS